MRIGRLLLAATVAVAALVLSSCGGSGIGNSFGKTPGIYFVDGGNNRMIWVSDMAGTDSVLINSSVSAVTNVVDGTIDVNGRLYLIDGNADAVVRLDDIQGDGRVVYGSHGNGTGQFLDPVRIAVDPSGSIYVVDRGRNALVRFSTNGSVWQTLDLGAWFAPGDKPALTVDAFGHIYMAGAGQVVKLQGFTAANAVTYGTAGSGTGNFSNPSGIALDAFSRIYIADTGNDRIVRITDITGAGWVAYGTNGAGNGNFAGPSGISVDHVGLIYIGDGNNHRIVRISDMTGANWTELDNLPSVSFGQAGAVFAHLPTF